MYYVALSPSAVSSSCTILLHHFPVPSSTTFRLLRSADLLQACLIHRYVGEVRLTVRTALSVNIQHISPATLSAETTLRDGGMELDSIDILEIVVAVESNFKVKVPDATVGRQAFQSLGSIADFVMTTRQSQLTQ